VSIYQGDDPNALNNILVGRFLAEGFSRVPAGNEILCRMELDLDGILRVTVTEKRTGLAKHVTIEGATTALSEAEVRRARHRMQELFGDGEEDEYEGEDEFEVVEEDETQLRAASEITGEEEDRDRQGQIAEARALVARGRRLLEKMNPEDREEAIALHEHIENALNTADWPRLRAAATALADLLFYVEEG